MEAHMSKLQLRRAGLGAVLLGGSTAALADVPAAFTTAVSSATTDGAAMAAALIGIAAAVVIVMIGVKFVKRIKGAV
jgi:hypothetical protein